MSCKMRWIKNLLIYLLFLNQIFVNYVVLDKYILKCIYAYIEVFIQQIFNIYHRLFFFNFINNEQKTGVILPIRSL